MGETRNHGKLRVFIDWEDKGVPVFDQESTHDLNLIPDAGFMSSILGFEVNAGLGAVPHIAPDSPLPDVVMSGYKNINPYGIEYLEITSTGGTLEIGTNLTTEINPDTDYTLWAWVATFSAFTNDMDNALVLGVYQYESDLTTIVSTTNTPFDTQAGWIVRPVFHHFTTDSLATNISAIVIHDPDGLGDPFGGVILGLMLLEGSNENVPVWNDGTEFGYLDEITSYLTSAQGSIGKTQWEAKLFDEGVLALSLNNQTKIFSPENRDSDLFGLMNPYIRVWVLISDSDEKYTMLWSGFTQQFSLQTGIYNNRQAVITCRQGKYAVEAQDDSELVAAEDIYSLDALKLCFNGGYVIPTGATDPIYTTNHIIEDGEAGIHIPIFGIDFVGQEDKNYLTTLEDISELNGNYLFLSRYGRIIFKTYSTVKDADPAELPYGLTLETNYTYAPFDLYKSIIINYDVFTNASDIEMQGQEEVVPASSTDFPYTIYPTYNGKPLIGDVVLDVTSFLPVDYNAVIGSGSANASIATHVEGIYTWYSSLANNSLLDLSSNPLDARISFISRASGSVWYASAINQSIEVTGIDGRGLPTLSYHNSLITTDDMADDFVNQQAERRASVVSWFNEVIIANKNDEATDFICSHSLGSVIYVQEEQSGNIPKHSIIIGENFRFTPTYIEMSYTIAPTGGEVDYAAFIHHSDELDVDFENLSVAVPEATYLWDFGD